jgi:putative flippase GtrA
MTVPVEPHGEGTGRMGLIRHGSGFLAAGVTALLVDIGVTSVLTRAVGLPPLVARLGALCVAVVVAWQCHRRWSFAVTTPSSWGEFVRFAAVAWSAAAVNYALYALALFVVPGVPPEVAVGVASVGSMFVSYTGMRFGVFSGNSGIKS